MLDHVQVSLLNTLGMLRHSFTRPGFATFLIIALGWIRCGSVRALTEVLMFAGVAGKRHHEAFHRFFSRGTWNPDRLGRALFYKLLDLLDPEGVVRVVIDDTLASKVGPHVFGISSHIDAVLSTRKRRVFRFGHCWVVLAVIVSVPFSSRPWALPVLFRLYRGKKECARKGDTYRKKTELAREMLDVLLRWTNKRVELATDSAYCNETVLRALPERACVFGSMRPDAALTALPEESAKPRAGRPAIRGKRLPSPKSLAEDNNTPWKECRVFLYRRLVTVGYKTIDAQWYQVTGGRLLRIVVVATERGTIPFRVFFCTDTNLEPPAIIAGYGARWAIECTFRDVKQHLGFADSQARTQNAVERVAPFVGLLFSLLVTWFIECGRFSTYAVPPVRPWYRHKQGLSFQDILRAARRAIAPLGVLDLALHFAKSRKLFPVATPLPSARDGTAA